MTATEKLLREIEALRDSIEIDWEDLNSNPLREDERRHIRDHLEKCQAELQKVTARFLATNESG